MQLFNGLQFFPFTFSCNTSSNGLLPLLLRTCMSWYELLNFSCIYIFCPMPAHDGQRWRAVSSINCITKMFQITEAFLHLREIMCIFRHVLTTDRFHTVSISHAHMVKICWFTKKLCLIFQSWNYAALILNTVCSFFVFCHVIEDKCWKHSFKPSMRLKCTARKECIKYINKSLHLKMLCS